MGAEEVGRSRKWVRVIVFVVPAVLFIAVLVAATIKSSSSPAPGDPAPGFDAPMLASGDRLSLEELRGRPVVLNFWASWCIPCKDEAPMLRRAWRMYGDRVAFVGIDIRDARSDALRFIDETGLAYDHVRDETLEIYEDYGLTGQPETFFIDHEGVIVEHVNGPLFEDSLLQLLDVLVARAA